MPSTVDLDRSTPKRPEALINLSAPATITVGRLTTPLTSLDVRAEAVDLVAKQAAAHGHPIRAKASTDDGLVQRMIVTEAGRVVLIGNPAPGTPPKTGTAKAGPTALFTRAAGRFGAGTPWFRRVITGDRRPRGAANPPSPGPRPAPDRTGPSPSPRRAPAPSTVDLDNSTPKWPEALINLSAPAKITVGGLTTPLTSLDVRAEAVDLVAKQAAAHGHPIRAKASTDDGWVQRMIVTEAGQVVLIGKPPPGTPPPRTGKGKPTTGNGQAGPAAPISRAAERFATVPTWFRWVVIGAVLALVLALLVLVLHRKPDPAPAAAPPAPPVPAAGQVYTETPPPGWTGHAAWVVPLATHSPAPVTDPVTGFTSAITPTDQSAPGLGPFDDNDLYLSALAPDGHTAWAAPLDRLPVLGPALATIDGVQTVVTVDARTATYWPLTGGQPTVVDLPTGARATENPGTSVLFIIGRGRAGYLSAGKVQIVEVLPRTKPLAAVDGAVLQWQEDKEAWWNVSAAAPPRRVTVTPAIAAATAPPVHVKPVPGQLVPTGQTSELLMVVTAGCLYALTREP